VIETNDKDKEEILESVLNLVESRIKFWESSIPEHLTKLVQQIKITTTDVQNFCRKIVVDELKFLKRNVKKLKEEIKQK
jgi:DNA-binding ferritin-like protein (Dps family)